MNDIMQFYNDLLSLINLKNKKNTLAFSTPFITSNESFTQQEVKGKQMT